MGYKLKVGIAKIRAAVAAILHNVVANEVHAGLLPDTELELCRSAISQRFLGSGDGCFQECLADTGGVFVRVVIVGGIVRMGSAAVDVFGANAGGGAYPLADPLHSHTVDGQKIGAEHQNGVLAGSDSHASDADIVCHTFGQTEFVVTVTGQMHLVIRGKGLAAIAGQECVFHRKTSAFFDLNVIIAQQ